MAKQLSISALILGAGLLGFFILTPFSKAVLWLVFMIVAYPPALAFTKAGRLPSKDLIEVYRIGVSQIPFIGQAIVALMSHGQGKDRPSVAAETRPGRIDPKD